MLYKFLFLINETDDATYFKFKMLVSVKISTLSNLIYVLTNGSGTGFFTAKVSEFSKLKKIHVKIPYAAYGMRHRIQQSSFQGA